jgi:nicotinate (nicotinamide) nucleotide adenylyltransferase
MKRVGLFGGSFNPIANHHVAICLHVLKLKLVDHVILVPCLHGFHGKKLASFQDRVRMCDVHVKSLQNGDVSVSDIESKYPSFATDTVKMVSKIIAEMQMVQQTQFFFILGLDNALNIDKWVSPKEAIQLLPYIVISRPFDTTKLEAKSPAMKKDREHWFQFKPHIFLDDIEEPASSTLIREAIAQKNVKKLSFLVHPHVAEYILQRDLYV